jgi:hypothetical protein
VVVYYPYWSSLDASHCNEQLSACQLTRWERQRGYHVMLCSKLYNWFVRLPTGESVHSSRSHHQPWIVTKGCQRVIKMLGGEGRGESTQHSAPGFQKPVAGEHSPTPFLLNPLYPGHATRSTQLTTGLSPWLPQFPPSISSFAGYQPVLLYLVGILR